MGLRQNNCEVRRHEATIDFNENDFGIYFRDFTENHYKAMVIVTLTNVLPPASAPAADVVVTPRTGGEFFLQIPPSGQLIIQIEDARSVSIRKTLATLPSVSGSIQIIKDFCICCP